MGLKPAKAHNPDSHGLMLLLTGPWLIIYSKILLLTKAINLLIYLQTGWDYRNILEVINKLYTIVAVVLAMVFQWFACCGLGLQETGGRGKFIFLFQLHCLPISPAFRRTAA